VPCVAHASGMAESATPLLKPESATYVALRAAARVVDLLAAIDRCAQREHRTVPTWQERNSVHDEFWGGLVPTLAWVERVLSTCELAEMQCAVQGVLNQWFLRSRLWARSFLKPHGYAGDFRMLEWMYELERDDCADATQPAAINILDGLYRSVHSVQVMWHRRAWFANLIAAERANGRRPTRVLDVACGGSRYVRDVVERHKALPLAGTFLDQDAAALAFLQKRLPAHVRQASSFICGPIRRLPELLLANGNGDVSRFDIVVSTGLFDYLSDGPASQLLTHMTQAVRPGGVVAICNFAPSDPSRTVKDWVGGWHLIYRTQSELAALFPAGTEPVISPSPDGGLLYARARAFENQV
jgi:extracellular factor (EF) 3-hydroxypalmitic acid methyl ester biosynthesis protein